MNASDESSDGNISEESKCREFRGREPSLLAIGFIAGNFIQSPHTDYFILLIYYCYYYYEIKYYETVRNSVILLQAWCPGGIR